MAPTERLFSQGALVLNKLRNRMSKDTFEYIMTLKSWGIFKELDIEVEIPREDEFTFNINEF